jgi:hypothetical protein
MMENHHAEQTVKNQWLVSRAPGCFIFILGLVATYIGIIQPLREMLSGVDFISYSIEVVGAAILAILFGLTYIAFGQEELNQLFTRPGKKGVTISGLFFVLFIIGITLLGIWLWEQLVSFLGYG